MRSLEAYPDFNGAPIHVLGNPRSDLLRPELRGFYADQADALKRKVWRFHSHKHQLRIGQRLFGQIKSA